MPFRKINIPMETPSYKLDDIALGDILIVGKARLKIDNFDPAKPLAKESSSLVERLMQLALESKDGILRAIAVVLFYKALSQVWRRSIPLRSSR